MADIATYALLLHVPVNVELEIDSLGELDFPAGFYVYVDQTAGAERLAVRLKQHLSPVERPRRHIDYLQQVANVEEIWLHAGPEARVEAWADLLLAIPGGISLFEGFGTNDSEWRTHLIYFDVRPSLEDFSIGVHNRFPDDVVLRAYARDGGGETVGI